MTIIAACNLMLGVMLVFSAIFNFALGLLQITADERNYELYGGVALAGAILGIASGVFLLKSRREGPVLSLAFAVALLGLLATLLLDGLFSPPQSIAAVYALFLLGFHVRSLVTRAKSERPAAEGTER